MKEKATYRIDDAAQSLEDENRRSVVFRWVLLHSLDADCHKLFSL